jgi:hypothetical protein
MAQGLERFLKWPESMNCLDGSTFTDGARATLTAGKFGVDQPNGGATKPPGNGAAPSRTFIENCSIESRGSSYLWFGGRDGNHAGGVIIGVARAQR